MEQIILTQAYTLSTIDEAAERFWETAAKYRLVAFSGDMGAGKTTLISHICRHLGVTDAVSSPTFALVNEYCFTLGGATEETIFHIDLYRLRDIDEAINAGMEDCVAQAAKGYAYCFIEWPEKAIELFRTPYLWVSIETTGMEDRKMTVTLVT
jgi:tRNA threonylcarbamoyladenosine biosynthesis protein TsaE